MQLRDYQFEIKRKIYEAWNAGAQNVVSVAPTGSGKTAIESAIFNECRVPGCMIAHRQELVGQISNAVAESGTYHRIIAPQSVINFCISQHVELFGRSFVNNQSPMAVTGVDTLLRRSDDFVQWRNQVLIWGIDEGHHVLRENKWGKAVNLFTNTNVHGVGFTATPYRADKKGIGRLKAGVFDAMVVGPQPRELINRGYLADYKIFGPPQSINTDDIEISKATGDFNQDQLRKAAHKSTITGDIVDHYLKLTPGKRGITFCVDIEIATETAAAFRQKGVTAEVISSKTPDNVRVALIKKFRNGEILELVNVDLFGEGMDVPAVEVVSMGRPTESLGLYRQQCGRMMRPAPGKQFGVLLDHVGNVKRHGLPDAFTDWSLDDIEQRRGKKKDMLGIIPVTTCLSCYQAYERISKACPYCGFVNVPAGRSQPEFVDGDLLEYDSALLDKLGFLKAKIDQRPAIPLGASPIVIAGIHNRHFEAQEAQHALRDCMALWAGVQHEIHGRSLSEMYRRFYWTFGIDAGTAQTLGRADAEKLTALIREQLT